MSSPGLSAQFLAELGAGALVFAVGGWYGGRYLAHPKIIGAVAAASAVGLFKFTDTNEWAKLTSSHPGPVNATTHQSEPSTPPVVGPLTMLRLDSDHVKIGSIALLAVGAGMLFAEGSK